MYGDEYVYVYEPDGTLNCSMLRQAAIAHCKSHPGWYWAEID